MSVQATVGSTITLECTVSGSIYQWQKWLDAHWSNVFQNSSKYGNANTTFLNIYNIAIDDAGTYRCTATGSNGSQQLQINITVTGMSSRQEKHITIIPVTKPDF